MTDLPWRHWRKRLTGFFTNRQQATLPKRRRTRLNLEALEAREVPSTVMNLNDAGPGSLRQAILDTPAGGTVDFQPGLTGTIALTTGALALSKDVAIAGPGASVITVSGNRASRVFNTTASVSISGLTIADGLGSGIFNSGRLTINGAVLRNNSGMSTAGDGSGGGGIFNSGVLAITDSVLTGNSVTFANGNRSGGGAIYNTGALTVSGTTVTANSVTYSSGGDDGGGGIYNFGTATITDSTISDNFGGGIMDQGTATVTNSTVSDNSNIAVGGGDFYYGGNGGGIDLGQFGTGLTITGSTISGNFASFTGGGILSFGRTASIIIDNSTISDNTAGPPPVNSGNAGGIAAESGSFTITNSTISGNSATYAGGILGSTLSTTTTIRNTIVAGNSAPTAPDVSFPVRSQGHNLIGDGSGGSGYDPTDLVGTAANPIDPRLGPLQDNGGSTQTMALLPGSPAIDAGDNAFSPGPYDQRGPGSPRIVNGIIDIGAFELQVVAPTVTCSVAGSLLWPPNHRLVNVGLGVAVDPPDANLSISVYANDSASPADAADIGPGTLRLRAEPQGNGTGRVYLVVVTAANAGGTSFDICSVAVPHDHSPRSIAAAQQQAAAAEAYYRENQTAPPGYDLLGEGPDGGGDAPAPGQSGKRAIRGDTFRLASALPATSQSPFGPASVTAAPVCPADELFGAWMALRADSYFANASDEGFRFLVGGPAPAWPDAVTGAVLDLLPGDDRLLV